MTPCGFFCLNVASYIRHPIMDHAQKIKSILNRLTSPLYEDSPFSTSKREPEYLCDGDSQGLTFQAFYNRVSTFGVKNWGADPNTALYLAKYGFQNVSGYIVRCCSCRITVDLEVFRGKRDILATIATQSHKSNCRWLHLSTPGEYFQIPRNPMKAYEDFLVKVKDLLTFCDEIPKIKTHALSEELLQATKEEIHVNDLNSYVIVSAACMAVCGWEKSSDSTFHCRFCQRRCGIWSFVSVRNPVLGEPLVRKTPNRVVSLIINQINSEVAQGDGSSDKCDDVAQHSEGLCSSGSPSDESESSSSDETDDTNYMPFKVRLRSRSFFDAQARKRNALKILRRKALMQKWSKTSTSSGGESGPEELESNVRDSEQRSSFTSCESDQSVIPMTRNKNIVNYNESLISENHAGVQQNGYSIIGYPEDFPVSKSQLNEVVKYENKEGVPLVNSNVHKSDKHVQMVSNNSDASKENDCVSAKGNLEFERSYRDEDHRKETIKEHISAADSKGVLTEDNVGVRDTSNVPKRDQRINAHPQCEQNGESIDGDCMVINTTARRSVSDGDDVVRPSTTTDGSDDLPCETANYFGTSNLQNNVNNYPNTKPTLEKKQRKADNNPNVILSQEKSNYNANNNHSEIEAMNIEERAFGESYKEESFHNESYSDGHYHEESYSHGHYDEENQFGPVICSVVGNFTTPSDLVEDQMEVCPSPQKDRELSEGTLIVSSVSSCKLEDPKEKLDCQGSAEFCCAALKSGSEMEHYLHSDTECTPHSRNYMCNKLVYSCCLKTEYYRHNYSEYQPCSNSVYYRYNYSGSLCCSRAEYYQSKKSEKDSDAKNPAALENNCYQGKGSSSERSSLLMDKVEGRVRKEKEKNRKRKRQLSLVQEVNEPKQKKVHNEQPKVIFDPVLDHRYWCLWKIKTEDPTGVSGLQKAGWEFYMDAIAEGFRLKSKLEKRLSYNEERDKFYQCLEAISNLGRYCK